MTRVAPSHDGSRIPHAPPWQDASAIPHLLPGKFVPTICQPRERGSLAASVLFSASVPLVPPAQRPDRVTATEPLSVLNRLQETEPLAPIRLGSTPAPGSETVLLVTSQEHLDAAGISREPDDVLLHRALEGAGYTVHDLAWGEDRASWLRLAQRASAVIVRSCWDYYRDRKAFLALISALGRSTRVLNPPSVIGWNTHKRYLSDLARLGIATIPTVWVSRQALPHLERCLAAVPWQNLVIKPTVATNAFETHLVSREEVLQGRIPLSPTVAEWMVQPYLPGVEEPGEHALVFIGGRFSHAFRKVAFREISIGGQEPDGEVSVAPEGAAIQAADRVLRAAASHLHFSDTSCFLFARVDLVKDRGVWKLMELELVEPRLRLSLQERAIAALVEQIRHVATLAPTQLGDDRMKELVPLGARGGV